LAFLNSDEAHDLFTNTFNFVQVSAVSKQRDQAAAVLRAAGLNKLATSAQLDAFTKVKAAIDNLVADLKKQKDDESKHRDSCIKNLNDNDRADAKQTRDNKDSTTKIALLTEEISQLEKDIETLNNEVANLQTELKRAGENREKENAQFQVTVKDQTATIALLTKAMDVLKAVFAKSAPALIQQAPPAGFKGYEQNSASGGVIGMITQIIEDSKAMKAEATHDENDSQAAYEEFVQESNASITLKTKQTVEATETKAGKEEEKIATEKVLADGEVELEQLRNAAAELHSQCDYFIKTFDQRQGAMQDEIEALAQAKAILSGSGGK